jgi:hypothetical protein
MRLKDILLTLLFLICVTLLLRKVRQITVEVKRAKIWEPDGSLRKPTTSKRMAIADKLAHEKGKYFWWLVLTFAFIFTVPLVLGIVGVFS